MSNIINFANIDFSGSSANSSGGGSSSGYSDVDGMCYAYSAITEFPEGWKFAPRTGYSGANLFEECYNLITIPQLDTSEITNFSCMFSGCSSLTTVPQLNVSKATTLYEIVYGCSSLTTLGGFIGLSINLDLAWAPYLTHDSLMNVINNLATVTSSTKLTLNVNSSTILTDEEKKIATDKGWTLKFSDYQKA